MIALGLLRLPARAGRFGRAAVVEHLLAVAAVAEASIVVVAAGNAGAARRVRETAAGLDRSDGEAGSDIAPVDLWRCSRAVARAAALVPWRVRCLPASLALHRLLAWRGAPSAVRLGVRADGGTLLAHAWVECGGLTLDPLSPEEAYEPLPFAAPTRGTPSGGRA